MATRRPAPLAASTQPRQAGLRDAREAGLVSSSGTSDIETELSHCRQKRSVRGALGRQQRVWTPLPKPILDGFALAINLLAAFPRPDAGLKSNLQHRQGARIIKNVGFAEGFP